MVFSDGNSLRLVLSKPQLSHLCAETLPTSVSFRQTLVRDFKAWIQVSPCDHCNLLFLVRLWVVSREVAGILKSYSQYIDTLAF